MSDWFIEEADEWRDSAWNVIRETPHIYQILTKRPERIRENLPELNFRVLQYSYITNVLLASAWLPVI